MITILALMSKIFDHFKTFDILLTPCCSYNVKQGGRLTLLFRVLQIMLGYQNSTPNMAAMVTCAIHVHFVNNQGLNYVTNRVARKPISPYLWHHWKTRDTVRQWWSHSGLARTNAKTWWALIYYKPLVIWPRVNDFTEEENRVNSLTPGNVVVIFDG